jgi:hypothetical protein
MRERKVGGYEPDEREQRELSELWHTSRTAIAVGADARRAAILKHGNEHYWRMHWCIDEFMKAHAGEPNVAHKWVYNWCVEYLGRHVDPHPVPYGPGVFDGEPTGKRSK